MTVNRPRNWPDGQSSNTPSSASSFGFDVAAELSRLNHPTARGFRGPHRFPSHDLDADTDCSTWRCAACGSWLSEYGELVLDDCPVDWLALDRPVAYSTRADLVAFPQEQEVGAPSADRRRHDDRSRPTAAAVGAASSTPAGARRGLIALASVFVAGWLLGRASRH